MEPNTSSSLREQEPCQREDWMNMKSILPCVFNEKKSASCSVDKKIDKSVLDKMGQSDRELNPYWKNGGNGLPCMDSIKMDTEQQMDADWLKKSLRRAQEQAEKEGRSLEEIAANRWGVSMYYSVKTQECINVTINSFQSLEAVQLMISKAERMSKKKRSENMDNNKKSKFENQSEAGERYGSSKHHLYCPTKSKRYKRSRSRSRSHERYKQYKECDGSQFEKQQKQKYRKPTDTDSDCFVNASRTKYYSGIKKWQKEKISDIKEKRLDLNASELKATTDDAESNQTKPMTEAEMNKLGAKIVKAEIMGNVVS